MYLQKYFSKCTTGLITKSTFSVTIQHTFQQLNLFVFGFQESIEREKLIILRDEIGATPAIRKELEKPIVHLEKI